MASRQRPTPRSVLFGAAAATATMALALGPQVASAAPDRPAVPDTTMQSAMERDLGLSTSQSSARLAAEKRAAASESSLRDELGVRFAGAWFDADAGRLQVAVTDSASASTVRSEGADAQKVTRSEADLDAVMKRLDAQHANAPTTIPGWFVDVESNRVVVQHRGSAAEAKAFVKEAGAPSAAISYEASREQPQPLDVVGGNAYFINNAFRCSVGFAVNGGFITAGHCGAQGATTTTPTGSFAGSSFPGNDYAFVRTSETTRAVVNNYSGGTVAVRGSSSAPIGSSICRSGSTTGWRCGTIQARNSTVNYAEGSVSGLIRTTACAEGGDSGGSALSGNQAQGVTSGGSGNCTVGGTTYFQPVGEILNAYGLTLKTS
ncbi:S1 family peptidase [Aeromicrobium sp. CF3.5]|uniref:S1 family peptidase n=1 Tax=Aeromicrobium sp. CF3.5 TaxID=3373078 RepID=UPI003EE647CD